MISRGPHGTHLLPQPFGTDSYDELIQSTLQPALHVDVEIRHLSTPRNIDYYAPSISPRPRS